MKKRLTFGFAIVILLMCFVSTRVVFALHDGDLNSNGQIDTSDIRLYLSGLVSTETPANIADLNNDGVIDTLDVRVLLDLLMDSDIQANRLLAFKTPANSSISRDELENNRVAKVIRTYDEFEEACAKISYAFYTPYENEDGSFDAWKNTITPSYFESHALFILSHGTTARHFGLEYTVSENAVEITLTQSDWNIFSYNDGWQLIVELDQEDLIDRNVVLNIINAY